MQTTSILERIVNDTRVRLAAAVVGVMVIAASVALVNVTAPEAQTKTVSVLPAVALDIPVLRQLPAGEPRRAEVVAPGLRTEKKRRAFLSASR